MQGVQPPHPGVPASNGRRRVHHRKAASDTFAWAASALLQEMPGPSPPQPTELGPLAGASGGRSTAFAADGATTIPGCELGAGLGSILPDDLLDLLQGVEEDELDLEDVDVDGDLDGDTEELGTTPPAARDAGRGAGAVELARTRGPSITTSSGAGIGLAGTAAQEQQQGGGPGQRRSGESCSAAAEGPQDGSMTASAGGPRHVRNPSDPLLGLPVSDKPLAEFAGQTRANALDPSQLDPKRAKRIIANRQSAHRSRMKKLQVINELEQQVAAARTATDASRQQVVAAAARRRELLLAAAGAQHQLVGLRRELAAAGAMQAAVVEELRQLGVAVPAGLAAAAGRLLPRPLHPGPRDGNGAAATCSAPAAAGGGAGAAGAMPPAGAAGAAGSFSGGTARADLGGLLPLPRQPEGSSLSAPHLTTLVPGLGSGPRGALSEALPATSLADFDSHQQHQQPQQPPQHVQPVQRVPQEDMVFQFGSVCAAGTGAAKSPFLLPLPHAGVASCSGGSQTQAAAPQTAGSLLPGAAGSHGSYTFPHLPLQLRGSGHLTTAAAGSPAQSPPPPHHHQQPHHLQQQHHQQQQQQQEQEQQQQQQQHNHQHRRHPSAGALLGGYGDGSEGLLGPQRGTSALACGSSSDTDMAATGHPLPHHLHLRVDPAPPRTAFDAATAAIAAAGCSPVPCGRPGGFGTDAGVVVMASGELSGGPAMDMLVGSPMALDGLEGLSLPLPDVDDFLIKEEPVDAGSRVALLMPEV